MMSFTYPYRKKNLKTGELDLVLWDHLRQSDAQGSRPTFATNSIFIHILLSKLFNFLTDLSQTPLLFFNES